MDGGPATELPTAKKKSKKRMSWPPEVSAYPFARLAVDGLSMTCCTCETRNNYALTRCQYAYGLTQWHRHLTSKSHEDATNNAEHEKKTAKKKKKPVSKQVAMLEYFEREPKKIKTSGLQAPSQHAQISTIVEGLQAPSQHAPISAIVERTCEGFPKDRPSQQTAFRSYKDHCVIDQGSSYGFKTLRGGESLHWCRDSALALASAGRKRIKCTHADIACSLGKRVGKISER
jgi:hypothetical protein